MKAMTYFDDKVSIHDVYIHNCNSTECNVINVKLVLRKLLQMRVGKLSTRESYQLLKSFIQNCPEQKIAFLMESRLP